MPESSGTIMYMKSIRVTFDEKLLERFDRLPVVRKKGRSAAIREAVTVFLSLQGAKDISHRYRAGYSPGINDEVDLQGWSGEGAWSEG